ncbi:MAG: protein kinase, partial [Proteobacteria bacterium]|nr:protein kinase [Pseudomonadota bacterium]
MQVIEAGYQVDRYTVEHMLGQGGVAHVYLLRHNELGSLHALKVLQVPLGTQQDRLLTEGRVQSALNHPNIVNVTDVVDIDGSPGLVMEYVAGPSLDDLLKRNLLTIDQIDSIARAILAGVATAHQLGLVHRDLKPANVLLAPTPQGPVPKVTDFGLAKFLDLPDAHGVTRTGVTLGTPAYMAPEQIRDAKGIDARADVFSLGAVLYELATGRRAFSGNDTMELFEAIIKGRCQPLSKVAPGLPARMVKAIEGALEPDLEHRFADAGQILRVWCADSPRPKPQWSEDLLYLESLSPDPTSSASISRSNPTFAVEATVAADAPPAPRRLWVFGIALLTAVLVVAMAMALWPEPPAPIGEAPQISDDPVVQEQVVRGWRAMLDGDLESAQRAFVAVAEREHEEAVAHYLVSLAYGLDQVHGKSARSLDAASIRLGSTDKWANLIEMNNVALTTPGRPSPDEWEAFSNDHQTDYLTQMVVAQWAGQPIRAEAAQRLVDLRPTPIAYVIATKAHSHLPEKAEQLAREMVQRYPDTPIAWEALGTLEVQQRDWPAARDAFTKALEANPAAALSRLNLANTHETLGELEERNHHRGLAYGE